MRPYKLVFYFTAAITILIAFLAPLRPLLIQYTFDNHIVKGDSQGLVNMTLVLVGLLIFEGVLYFFNTYYANWLGQVIIKDLRIEIYKHFNTFRMKYFDRAPVGTIITRLVSDMEAIASIFSQGLLVMIGDLLQVIVIISFMFKPDIIKVIAPSIEVQSNWKLAMLCLSTLPVLLVATWFFKNAVKKAFRDVRTQIASLNTFVQEHIVGISIVQIFNKEEEEYKKFKSINKDHLNAHVKSVWAYSVFLPVVEVLSSISIALVVWWGAKETLAGVTSFGNIVAFILYVHMMFRPIRNLADRFNTLQMGMVSSERIFNVLDANEMMPDEGVILASRLSGNISFQKVWFAYNNEEWVLKNVSLTINSGETIALVGATGSGKSSIVNLLSRFYEFNKGEITIDGQDIRKYKIASLRKNIALVLQDVFLFSDTIYNNVTLFNPNITRVEVVNAAKIVGAHDFIMEMPGTYDYNVRERGAVLSSGQRQLIAFLRAYVHNPSILILDEATSSIDTSTEVLIQNAIVKLTENRTAIIIAHRLATIRMADKILVLDKGKLIEQGTHKELIKKSGYYKRLYEYQFEPI